MPRMSLILGAAIVSLGVSACAGAPAVQPVHIGGSYSLGLLGYAQSRGGLLTEVIGNPFQAPKEELDAAVLETMARSHFGPHVRFIAVAPEGYTSPYHVVVAMNPVPATTAQAMCRREVETRPRGPRDPDRVSAVFCSDGAPLTSTSGLVFGPTGPRDPAFIDLLAQVSLELFPPVDTRRDGSRRRGFLIPRRDG